MLITEIKFLCSGRLLPFMKENEIFLQAGRKKVKESAFF